MTNCPNCGAPVNRMHHKCEYCGTPYEDVPALPRVEPKVELIQEEVAPVKQALDILLPMIVSLLVTTFIPIIIGYFLS